MKYKSISLTTNHSASDLIASAFFDAGAEGVSIYDKEDFKDLLKSDVIWDYVDETILNSSSDVKICTLIGQDDTEFEQKLVNYLEELKSYSDIKYGEIVTGEVDEADWANEWKKYYKPIQTKQITIVPTWIKYQAKDSEKVMMLDPGMAFGTGEHATTKMCLELMDAKDKTVIDVGCGSGILGIASALTGAKSVYMCDIDPQAVEFAKRNAELNNIVAEIEEADLLCGNRRADFVFANLTADILMRLSLDLKDHLNENATIVVSGIINSRQDEVMACFESAGYKVEQVLAIDDWRAFKMSVVD